MGFAKLTAFGCALMLGAATIANADTIVGFENPAVLERVMKGEIVVEEKVATKKEFQTIFRAFFKSTTPDQYVDLATDHAKYPSMFSEIKEARTVNQNHERTEWDYWMKVVFKFGIFSQTVYPEGKQVYQRPVDNVSEGKLVHTLSNYKEHLKSAQQTTRLIPYQGGMLVHDDLSFTLVEANNQSTLIKNKLKEQFLRYLRTFRDVLKANP